MGDRVPDGSGEDLGWYQGFGWRLRRGFGYVAEGGFLGAPCLG